MDVNGDCWTDITSVNYRSASLFWIEHPGEKIKSNPDTLWTKHLIDNPGPMETGRLYDIDGDGRLDILPNGTTFAAWYELVRGPGVRSQDSGVKGQAKTSDPRSPSADSRLPTADSRLPPPR